MNEKFSVKYLLQLMVETWEIGVVFKNVKMFAGPMPGIQILLVNDADEYYQSLSQLVRDHYMLIVSKLLYWVFN